MNRSIFVEFSGWLTLDAKDAKFVLIGLSEELEKVIDGEKWLDLNNEERSNYLICMEDAENDALDGGYKSLDVDEDI